MKGFMYILQCCDGTYYTGITTNLKERFNQHLLGMGSNYTKERLPLKLVYFEEFQNIEYAFMREKQVQNWSQLKKEALIQGNTEELKRLSRSKK
jgi:putative endonuclease